MPFLIGQKRLIPAPVINIQRNSVFSADGEVLNTTYGITLNGTLLPNRGSPLSYKWMTSADTPPVEAFSTDDDKFNSLIAKQSLLRDAFAATGNRVEYSSPGYPTVAFYPQFQSIDFSQSNWVIRSDYTIALTTPQLLIDDVSDQFVGNSGYLNMGLRAIQDDYSVKELDTNTGILEITRVTSATAEFNFAYPSGTEPWRNARQWVINRLATSPMQSGLLLGIGSSVPTTSGYNLSQEETINKQGGTYTRTQKYTLHRYNYLDTRTITRSDEPNLTGDGGPDVNRINVDGVVQGFDINNTPSGKIQAARAYYSGFAPSLNTTIGAMGRPFTSNVREDLFAGSLAYSFSFINNTGSVYRHNYDVSYQTSNALPTVSIQGTIEGVTSDTFFYGTGVAYNKFDMAMNGWTSINGNLKSLAFATALIPSGTLYSDNPSAKTLSFNKPNGTVNYSYTYEFVGTGNMTNLYRNEYSVEYATDNAYPDLGSNGRAGLIVTATVNGSVLGYSPNNDPAERTTNARAGFLVVDNNAYGFAVTNYDLIGTNANPLTSGVVRKSVALNSTQGLVSYSMVFTNLQNTNSSGVAVQDVTVDDVLSSDVFAIQAIPGRSIGPIFQNIGTVTERRKTINIALSMYPKAPTGYYSYSDRSLPSNIASGIVVDILSGIGTRGTNWFLAGDSEQWNPKAGFYTRTYNIVY